jgi:hypothetical protein
MQAPQGDTSGSRSVEQHRAATSDQTGGAFDAGELPRAARLLRQPADTRRRRIRSRHSRNWRPRRRASACPPAESGALGMSATDRVGVQLAIALQEQLGDLRRRLDEAEAERAELRRILGLTAQTLAELTDRLSTAKLPAAAAAQSSMGGGPPSPSPEERGHTDETVLPVAGERPALEAQQQAGRSAWRWWRRVEERKRSAGAGLTLLGIAALLAGFAPRIEAARQTIDSTGHLGIVLGLVGLLVLLIGLGLAF